MKKHFWRIVAAFILVVSLISAVATVVSATGGPHEGTFTATTDSCAGCHRAHTGTAPKILTSTTQYNLCTTCHDGTSAYTKVTTGVYLGSTDGTTNAGLRGGGFETALMNTAVSGTFNETGTPAAITSKHTVGATSATAWGSGTAAGTGETVALECGNCHNPHGNSEYRILRPQPTSLDTLPTPAVNVPDDVTKNYTITYDVSNYRDMTGYNELTLAKMADWCGQCHTRYKAGDSSGSDSSAGGTAPDDWPAGTAPFEYRHMTQSSGGDLVGECLKCHVAHGTSASMSGNASGLTWPGGGTGSSATWQDTAGGEGYDSRLLHINNRGVCIQCHSTDITQN